MAEEVAPGRRLVVKVLEPELAQGISADPFAREAKLGARAITNKPVGGALYATYLREQGSTRAQLRNSEIGARKAGAAEPRAVTASI